MTEILATTLDEILSIVNHPVHSGMILSWKEIYNLFVSPDLRAVEFLRKVKDVNTLQDSENLVKKSTFSNYCFKKSR